MFVISTCGLGAGQLRRRLGALLAAVAVAAGMAATAVAPPASAAAGTLYVYVTNSADDTVSAYDAASRTVTATIPVGASPNAVAVSPDGRTVYIANQGGDTVSVISTATNTVSATITTGASPNAVAVSPDGRTVYTANGGGIVSVISTATNTVTATVVVGGNAVGVAVTPDGSTVYAATACETAVISTATNTVIATIPIFIEGYGGTCDGGQESGVTVNPDGSAAYVVDGYVNVVSTATNTVTGPGFSVSDAVAVAVSPDGRTLYTASGVDDTVSVFSTATGTVTATIRLGDGGVRFPVALAVSPDGTTAYVANNWTNDVSVICTATSTVTATIPVGDAPTGVAVAEVPPPLTGPAVTGVSLAHGPRTGGTSVTITGTGLAGATAVHFGTVPAAKFTVDSATQVTATAPAAASAGPVNVTITTPAGTSHVTPDDQYTYQPAAEQADVSAALSCPKTITAGHTSTCTLTAANAGPATAGHVTATIALPGTLTGVSCTPRCTVHGGIASWTLPALAIGAKARFSVTVRAGAPGKVAVLATARSRTPDPHRCNNSATARITITRQHGS